LVGPTGPIGGTGPTGPSTAINAVNDTATTVLYPVMIQNVGQNSAPKVRSTTGPITGNSAFSFNASSNTLTVANLVVSSGLTVNGTTTNLNTTNLVIEDKNIVIGDVATPTDVTASGGGITLLGATNKTIT
jgi:hypothetical protein